MIFIPTAENKPLKVDVTESEILSEISLVPSKVYFSDRPNLVKKILATHKLVTKGIQL
jgi:hypothetical protein